MKKTQLQSSWDLWIFPPPKYGIGFDPSPCGKMESRSAGSSCTAGEIPLQGERWDRQVEGRDFHHWKWHYLYAFSKAEKERIVQTQCQTMMVVQAS